MRIPLFWCISVKSQAALMQYQHEVYGTVLVPPTPPLTSEAVWATTWHESVEEIDRLMRMPPSRSRGKG